MFMEFSAAPYYNESGRIFYKMYHDLPIGAVLVDSKMMVLSSNRKMREYFPFCKIGPEGLLLGKSIRCCKLHSDDEICGESEVCQNCRLKKNIIKIINEKSQMDDIIIENTYSSGISKIKKWFKVNGFYLEYSGEVYAVLFFDDITEYTQHEKDMEKNLKSIILQKL